MDNLKEHIQQNIHLIEHNDMPSKNTWTNIKTSIGKKEKVVAIKSYAKVILLCKYAVAACVIGLAIVGAVHLINNQSQPNNIDTATIQQPINNIKPNIKNDTPINIVEPDTPLAVIETVAKTFIKAVANTVINDDTINALIGNYSNNNSVAFTQVKMCLTATTIFCTAQNTRSIGRKYSQKLIDQEKQFDEKNKIIKESTTTKDIAVEIPVARNIDVCIENTNRAVEIKTWDEPKIKIIVNATEASDKTSNETLLEKINVKTKLFGKSFRIIADVIGRNDALKSMGNNGKNILTIYVPKENSLCIKSKYADVTVLDAVKKVDVDITNGNLELSFVKNLSLISKYANVYINEVENAEIDFMNGDLSIVTVGNGEVETKYAKIEIGTAKKIALNSTNDDYEIEEIDVLDGNKNYGNMRIGKLNESIQLDGTNADVKIKKISNEVKSIWFDDKCI
ncbi:unnamed protein product [Rotaria sp. Silwood1]|nr:unnamed protein product [Rotaria sp. Silwood1]CAF4686713.1 unnamed protein product [Rotaria sp. Silwood1]